MADALLSVRNLSVEFTTYGQTNQVLRGVSLDVPARSQIALVGESGSGKTVTMRHHGAAAHPAGADHRR